MKSLCCLVLLCMSLTLSAQDYVYGLEFTDTYSDPNLPSPVCFGQLKLAKADLATGEMTIIQEEALSNGCHQSGVSDFDPFDKRYFYTNQQVLIGADVLTGETLFSYPLSDFPTSPNLLPTNIAYNWLDEKLYGLMQDYVQVSDIDWEFQLTPFSVDLESGEVTFLRDTPLESGAYYSGHADIDVISRQYVFANRDWISRIDLDTGEEVRTEITYPEGLTIDDRLINLAFDWTSGEWFGILHIFGFDDPEQLSLVRVLEDGTLEILSAEPMEFERFLESNSDIDALDQRYLFIADQTLHQLDLSTGEILSNEALEFTSDVIDPFINMAYDDLSEMPDAPIAIEMEDEDFIETEDQFMDVWVGDGIDYVWSDGLTAHSRQITGPGTYEVSITKQGLTFLATKTYSTPSTVQEFSIDFSLYPNPTSGEFRIRIDAEQVLSLRVLDMRGTIIAQDTSGGAVYDFDLSPGLYVLAVETESGIGRQVLIVE